jgi:hypothetical protein
MTWWQQLSVTIPPAPAAWERPTCAMCRKVPYEEARAKQVAALISEQRTPMFAYYSTRCGCWHLTRKPQH